MKITLVTGNWAKIAQAKEVLEPLGIEVDNVKMDTVEIQANSVEEVAPNSSIMIPVSFFTTLHFNCSLAHFAE